MDHVPPLSGDDRKFGGSELSKMKEEEKGMQVREWW
jgi:hypothetical protein